MRRKCAFHKPKVLAYGFLGGMVEQDMRIKLPPCAAALAAWAFASAAMAQTGPLTLAQAVEMARERNGTIRAAVYDLEAARSRTRESIAAFLPTLTPAFSYETSKSETFTGSLKGRSGRADAIADITASWRLLDSGEREWSHLSSKRLEEAAAASSLLTLRSILFTVYQQFYDALRTQELLKVAVAQVGRAGKIVEQTQAQIDVGAAAKKDILQVKADLANSQVTRLSAENQASIAQADLKATIGLESTEKLDQLVAPQEPTDFPAPPTLEESIAQGLANRQDLIALRKRREAQEFAVRTAERRAGLTWTLDTSYNRAFSPDVSDFASATFLVSYPLFDGGRLREQARQQKLGLKAQEAELTQAERDARAEIESAHSLLRQDVERVAAAKSAVEAATENYRAAIESQRLGAEGTDIITVLTAQVTLVNAEANYIEALYDSFISDVRLRLVIGQPIPGERA